MGVKSTFLMYLHKEGRIAEYAIGNPGLYGQYYYLVDRPIGDSWFSNEAYVPDGQEFPDWYESKEDAYNAAMDYHETEGCKLYLELYPAPEKGEWDWIAQDENGLWWAYRVKPSCNGRVSSWGSYGEMSESPIFGSPPNPFWRKTLR